VNQNRKAACAKRNGNPVAGLARSPSARSPVPARWRYSYIEGSELPSEGEFKLVVILAVADRKKLVNLKKGSWTTVTADPFTQMPVYLSDVEYIDGATRVSLIFTKTPPKNPPDHQPQRPGFGSRRRIDFDLQLDRGE
jgi:hypothetical protein